MPHKRDLNQKINIMMVTLMPLAEPEYLLNIPTEAVTSTPAKMESQNEVFDL